MSDRRRYKNYFKEDYHGNLPKSTKYLMKKRDAEKSSSSSSEDISMQERGSDSSSNITNVVSSTIASSNERESRGENSSSNNAEMEVSTLTSLETVAAASVEAELNLTTQSIDAADIAVDIMNESVFSNNYENDIYDSTDDDDYNEADDEDEEIHFPHSLKSLLQMLQEEDSNETISAKFVVNKIEIILAIIKFSRYYSLPNSATADLCKMINAFVDVPLIPDTRYLIDKLFYSDEGIKYHAVCPTCKMYVGQYERKAQSIVCQTCENHIFLKDPAYRDFFVTFDVRSEITHLLEKNSEYYTGIISQEQDETNEKLQDVHDGLLYKKFVASLPNDHKQSYCTASFNSDGSPVFKSSKFSVWPIQLNLHEIPVNVRNKSPITYALWFGIDKPNMNIFLSPLVNNMNELSEDGIPCQINGVEKKIKVYTLCCCVDYVARAPMQGITLFNGYYGCSWCLHPGELVFHKRGTAMKYTLLEDIPEKRTEDATLMHIQEAIQSTRPVYGMKKAMPLLNLKGFHIIQGFVPDSMHCVALGVAKQFSEYWFNSPGMPYAVSSKEILEIDKQIKRLKVPIQIARLSRSINDRRFWKAREWENWLLYYSLPILRGIRRLENYVDHWTYLVEGIHILMKNSITISKLQRADGLLKQFIAQTEYYYSKDAMSFNVHQLLHLGQSVADWGPLWAHSGYTFESGNGKIIKTIHAAKGVINQICRHITMKESLFVLEKHLAIKEFSPVNDFVFYLENRCTQRSRKIGKHRYFGKPITAINRLIEELHLSESHTRAYEKMVKDKCLFKSCNKVCARSNNSFALTTEGNFIQLVQFIVDSLNKKEYTVCKKVIATENFSTICTNIKKIAEVNNDLIAVETDTIDKLCVYMSVNNLNYIAAIPNMFHYS